MTRLLYETDPYMSRFDAQVEKTQGEWVILDRTAFFPGGGGQDADVGCMGGLEVTEVAMKGEVLHRVPGHDFKVGQRLDCEVDWERRHDLMRGHTGEHLLFSVLCKMNPEIELMKIAITPKKKVLVVKGEINWNLLALAQEEANAAIAAQLPVTEMWASKDSEVVKEIRIKVDRIHGDKVRIVKIGEIDKAACAGVHIQNTRELRMLLITKLTSAKPAGDYEIEFETGRLAMEDALRLASTALWAAEVAGALPEDLVNALNNLKGEMQIAKNAVRKLGRESLANLVPEKFEGVRLYSGVFEGIDKKSLIDAVNEFIKNDRTVAIMGAVDDRLMLVVASSKDLEVDCKEILTGALSGVGGKGGGGRNFASGGAATPELAKDVVEEARSLLRSRLAA